MFTPDQYRKKANDFGKLVGAAISRNEEREFRQLEKTFTVLADNEQWLADNHNKTVELERADSSSLLESEEHILQCLGAALIMQWNTLPTKLRRELFGNAGSMGELFETEELRGKIARFLHRHKNDEVAASELKG